MKFKTGEITKSIDLPYYDLIAEPLEDIYLIYYKDVDGGHRTEEDDNLYDLASNLITNVFCEI